MEILLVEIITLGVLILLSGFFSSSEVAYTGLTLSQIKRAHRLKPRALEIWEKSPDRVLATLLISNNAVNAGAGVLAAGMALQLSSAYPWRQSVITFSLGFLVSIFLLVFGEVIPKVWARRYPVTWALTVTPILNVWSKIISPIARLALKLTRPFISGRSLRQRSNPFLQKEELDGILTHSVLPTGSRRILNNLMDFSKSKVSEVMTHRSEMFAVSIQMPMEKIILNIIRSGFSRVPVYSGTLDNLKGILYAKDLLVAWRSGQLIVLEDLLRPIHYVPSDMPLSDLLRIFRTGHQHMAVVYNKIQDKRINGLITLQDAVETIVGPIREEV